jgi:hypothetical protein
MVPVESELTRRWLRAHADDYDRVEWNVRLGRGVDLEPGLDPAIERLAAAVTARRADLVAWRDGRPTIVEVARRAGLSHLGQVLGYAALWGTTFPGTPAPELVTVAESISSDMARVYANFGVRVELFPTG